MSANEPRRFWYALSAAVCGLILTVAARDMLSFYIHPRYHLFTIICSLVGFVLLTHATITYRPKQHVTITYKNYLHLIGVMGMWTLQKGAWFVVIVALLLVWSPKKPMLSTAADKKTTFSSSEDKSIQFASWYDNPTTVYEIEKVLSLQSGRTAQTGKTFSLTGFVRASSYEDRDVFRLSRFVMTCCAVDARPASVPVYFEDWQGTFAIDTWVQVDATLEMKQTGRAKQLVLVGKMTPTTQPDAPYEYTSF